MMLDGVDCMNNLWSTQLWFAFLVGVNVAMLAYQVSSSCCSSKEEKDEPEEEQQDEEEEEPEAAALSVRKFAPSSMLAKNIVNVGVIVGSAESGKSVLAADLMQNSGVQQWMLSMDESMDRLQQQFTLQKETPDTRERMGICFDPLYRTHTRMLETIVREGRACDCASLISVDHVFELPTACRSRVDAWFILGGRRSRRERTRLYDEIGGSACCTFEMFCKLLEHCTENYGCLVILSDKAASAAMAAHVADRSSSSNLRLLDRVFWYNASNPE